MTESPLQEIMHGLHSSHHSDGHGAHGDHSNHDGDNHSNHYGDNHSNHYGDHTAHVDHINLTTSNPLVAGGGVNSSALTGLVTTSGLVSQYGGAGSNMVADYAGKG